MRRTAILDLMLLWLGALAVRLLYLHSLAGSPLLDVPKVDAKVFWDMAQGLISGAPGDAVPFKPPLFVWLLAGLIKIFGDQTGPVRLAMALLSSLAAPLTFLLARPLLDRKGALAAGGLVALYAPAVFYGPELLPTSLILVLNLALLVVLLRAERGQRLLPYALAGGALGLSALAGPTILLLAPLLLWRYRRQVRPALALLVGATLVIAPVTMHNLRAGSLTLISSNGGLNFYLGNNASADGRSAQAPGLPNDPFQAREAAKRLAEAGAGHTLDPAAVSRYWYHQGWEWMRSHPLAALGLDVRKLYYLLNNREIGDNLDFYAVAETRPALRLLPFRFGLLFVLALPGFWFLRGRRENGLLLAFAASVVVSAVLFFMVGRFRLPLVPALAVAAVAGAQELWRRWRRDRRGLAGPLVLAATALVITATCFGGVCQDTSWHYYFQCADVWYHEGQIDKAIKAYEESIRRNDRIAAPRNALGFLYADRGIHLERAEALVRGALQLDPSHERYYLDSLGWVLYKRGDLTGAARELEKAIPLFGPQEAYSRGEAMYHLALVQRARGEVDRAAELLQAAAPDYPPAAQALASRPPPPPEPGASGSPADQHAPSPAP